ncbi:hypothetical protein Patl1_15265 [Pistacia atlantica]|uniref:Uncharacterized protein n=1 Tax=Pistacia atlantica TaxID=434234 RepID=A0ACC1B6P7_9ROSI|nr:hypothetical protein Patl1_15265 [Pistacia atlantica]
MASSSAEETNQYHIIISLRVICDYRYNWRFEGPNPGRRKKKCQRRKIFIGAIDQGTTSTRFIIYDQKARPIGSHQVEFTQFYPEAGYAQSCFMEFA